MTHIFASLSLTSFFICTFFGMFIYYQNRKDPLNFSFALFCMIAGIVSFFEFMYRQTDDPVKALISMKVSAIWPFIIPILIRTTLLFTEKTRLLHKKWFAILITAPAVFFTIIDFLFSKPVRKYWGYTRDIHPDITLSIIITFWMIGFGIFTYIMFIRFYLTTENIKKKKQLKYISVGFIVPFLILCITNLISPLLNIEIPELSNTSLGWSVIFMGLAIRKYGLFSVNPETAAENIISTMSDSLILFSPDMRIITVNNAFLALTGFKRPEAIGRQAEGIFIPEDALKQRYIISELNSEGTVKNTELRFLSAEGNAVPVSVSCSLILDRDNETAGIVYIARDIRETKELQAKLLQSGKMAAVGRLAGGVAHEINNPIGIILGFTQSIVKRMKEDDPLYLPLTSIEREAIRCKLLVGDLLTFSRTGKTEEEQIDINATIESALTIIRSRAKIANTEIEKQFQTGLPAIKAYRNQIQQVIINICNNSMDAIFFDAPSANDTFGKITIATSLVDGYIRIKIDDNGAGMPEDVKKHLFEPFYTTKEIGKGTGLGLSICYEIVKKHNGNIEIKSEPGKGTSVIILLPAGETSV